MPLRQAVKALAALVIVLGVFMAWWRWPEDTVSGMWTGSADADTIQVSLLQQASGDLHGHGVITTGSPRTVTASGKVEGTRAGDRIAITLSTDKQQVFTLFVHPASRGQLAGEYYKSGGRPRPITLTRN